MAASRLKIDLHCHILPRNLPDMKEVHCSSHFPRTVSRLLEYVLHNVPGSATVLNGTRGTRILCACIGTHVHLGTCTWFEDCYTVRSTLGMAGTGYS